MALLILLLVSLAITDFSVVSATNITLGTTLTAGQTANSSWQSPSGDFTFGFYPVNSSVFVLAIWFNATNPPVVVWTPNYTVPELESGSTLRLTDDGQLSLKDHTGTEVWNAGVIQASAAAVLDSGNLVLVSNDSTDLLWQSFDHPTDTLLPGQVMTQGTILQSWLNVSDFSKGRFMLALQTDGNLVFYPIALLGANYHAYWATMTFGPSYHLIYNISGSFHLTGTNDTRPFLSAETYPLLDFYQRITLDVDGVLRKYVHPRTDSSQKTWTIVDHMPDGICTLITNDEGGGACGFNSYCTLDEQGLAQCKCPDHFSFVDPSLRYKGCAPNFTTQSCPDNEMSADQYEFVPVNGLDWPQSNYDHYTNVSEQHCRESCLNDCYCVALVFGNQECWKNKLPLLNGRTVTDKITLFKVPRGNASLPSGDDTQFTVDKEQRRVTSIAAVVSSGFLNVSAFAFIIFLLHCYKKKLKKLTKNNQEDSNVSELNLRSFTYKELEGATNGFSRELGRGSFGIVYKGLLASSVPTKIAVKKLHTMLNDSKEFLNEARAIGQTHHKNLVKLIGLCNEGPHRLLVYEYMSNGSLTNFLFGSVRPNWNRRVEIALSIARGLFYLHEECNTGIIHCDIKPQNVLLDNNYVAKISDFGLAKLLKNDQTRTTISIRGTRGYVAPEWFKGKIITRKVDVYSFGIMLLEIISCRKSIESAVGEEEQVILADWSYDCYQNGKLEAVVDNEEEAMADFWRLERFVMVAIWCIQEDPSQRPSMYKVLQMLEGNVTVSLPPDPLSIN